jgi:hypothetical protein
MSNAEPKDPAASAAKRARERVQLAAHQRALQDLVESRELIGLLRQAAATGEGSDALALVRGLDSLGEAVSRRLDSLPLHTIEAAAAAANLRRALSRLDAIRGVPEAWGGRVFLVEALQLLGYAQAQCDQAEKLHRQRTKPRPPRGAKALILEAAVSNTTASSEAVRRRLEGKGVSVGARHIRRVRAEAKKG